MTLREELKRIQNAQKKEKDEVATKQALVLPILLGLGWDTKNTNQIVPECNLGKDNQQIKKVDYALIPKNSDKRVYIEVKKQGISLDKYVGQLMNYAGLGNPTICMLTNGIDWWLYLPREEGYPKDRKFSELNIKKNDIENLIKEFETYLSYDSLSDIDKVEQRAKQALEAKRNSDSLRNALPEIWQELLNNPTSKLIEVIIEYVNTSTGLIPTDDQVRCFLSAQTSKSTDLSQKIKINTVASDKEKKSAIKAPKIPIMIEILGNQLSVNTSRQIWISVVEELYSRNPPKFRSIIGKPHGKKIYIKAGNAGLKKPYRIGKTSYWIELWGSTDTLIKRSKYLLRLLGFNENDLTILYSHDIQKDQKILKSTKKVKSSNQPDAFTLFGATHSVKTWRDVFEGVANELYKRHTDNFAQVVGKPNGKRRSYVELSRNSMFDPRRVENSKYWIDANASAKELQSRCYYLLEQLGHLKTELKIHFY